MLKRSKHERALEPLSDDWDRFGLNEPTIAFTRRQKCGVAGAGDRSCPRAKWHDRVPNDTADETQQAPHGVAVAAASRSTGLQRRLRLLGSSKRSFLP